MLARRYGRFVTRDEELRRFDQVARHPINGEKRKSNHHLDGARATKEEMSLVVYEEKEEEFRLSSRFCGLLLWGIILSRIVKFGMAKLCFSEKKAKRKIKKYNY